MVVFLLDPIFVFPWQKLTTIGVNIWFFVSQNSFKCLFGVILLLHIFGHRGHSCLYKWISTMWSTSQRFSLNIFLTCFKLVLDFCSFTGFFFMIALRAFLSFLLYACFFSFLDGFSPCWPFVDTILYIPALRSRFRTRDKFKGHLGKIILRN